MKPIFKFGWTPVNEVSADTFPSFSISNLSRVNPHEWENLPLTLDFNPLVGQMVVLVVNVIPFGALVLIFNTCFVSKSSPKISIKKNKQISIIITIRTYDAWQLKFTSTYLMNIKWSITIIYTFKMLQKDMNNDVITWIRMPFTQRIYE